MTCKSPMKILVIDDDQPVLRVLVKVLVTYGYGVDTAETGAEGIQIIESDKFDLVLTDIKMPGMSGTEVTNKISQIKGNRLPVIGMTDTPWLSKNTLFDEVLIKPFSIKELIKVIQKYCPAPAKTETKKELQ